MNKKGKDRKSGVTAGHNGETGGEWEESIFPVDDKPEEMAE
jgi:hypothetical protein